MFGGVILKKNHFAKKYPLQTLMIQLFFITIVTFMIPALTNLIMDKKMLNQVYYEQIEGFQVKKVHDKETVKLEEKVAYVAVKKANFIAMKLQSGYLFSPYEARRESYKELINIEAINVEGVKLEESDITIIPYLFLDNRNPSKGFFAWKGTIIMANKVYEYWIDEETSKILRIELIKGNVRESIFEREKDELYQSWKAYMK